ncbi:hypothetical protein SLEP1_g36811 [Rubroshorea leprosula]|uniref:Uncharacterized protein n=1 Tax=Rubroshorea leprosula TaxID=152421 RepID=A0AAV5KSN1_9ROSI|nr:hypothetical protein SLEP1_g36811 [Rubroshorea leprosula]
MEIYYLTVAKLNVITVIRAWDYTQMVFSSHKWQLTCWVMPSLRGETIFTSVGDQRIGISDRGKVVFVEVRNSFSFLS